MAGDKIVLVLDAVHLLLLIEVKVIVDAFVFLELLLRIGLDKVGDVFLDILDSLWLHLAILDHAMKDLNPRDVPASPLIEMLEAGLLLSRRPCGC